MNHTELPDEHDQEAVVRLTKDLKVAVTKLKPKEVIFLVRAYYQMQEARKRTANQVRALTAENSPHEVLDWLSANKLFLEKQVKSALQVYADSQPLGQWAQRHVGVGPVITSGLLAHIDISKAPTYGHVWSYAGLTTGFNMPVKWEKGEKRPWNAELKTLCWKASDCFVKFSGREDCFYGRLYANYKVKLVERNERGEFKSAAEDGLKRVGKTTDAYKAYAEGKLPPGHLDARARRFVVKIFLSHYWEEGYRQLYGKEPPPPYPVAHQGHAHIIKSPI